MKNIYIIGLLIFIFVSCKEEKATVPVVSAEGDVTIKVSNSAGDMWTKSDDFLPLPFNIGKVGNNEVLILSKRIAVGKEVDVKLLGAVRFAQNDTLVTYLLSIPSESEYQTIKVDDFDEFSTVYSSAKWIIEQYMMNRKPRNRMKLKSWESEKFAIKHMLD